ncbi:Maf family protein, partial [Gammaproteobacteria bacterium]|nr:Maf family protein [Gammaproteobacteria bacterium]
MDLEKVLFASISPKIPIILASGSQSRKQMLEEAGICFEIIKTDTNEDALKKEMFG